MIYFLALTSFFSTWFGDQQNGVKFISHSFATIQLTSLFNLATWHSFSAFLCTQWKTRNKNVLPQRFKNDDVFSVRPSRILCVTDSVDIGSKNHYLHPLPHDRKDGFSILECLIFPGDFEFCFQD